MIHKESYIGHPYLCHTTELSKYIENGHIFSIQKWTCLYYTKGTYYSHVKVVISQ